MTDYITRSRAIKSRLLARGVKVRDGLTVSELERIKSEHLKLHQAVESLYSVFDGFEEGFADDESQISIWPLGKSVQNIKGATEDSSYSRSFADFLIGSNEYATDLTLFPSPITDPESGLVITSDLLSFLEEIAEGKHDF